MALEGSLKEFGLADILQLIYFQRKSGVLTIQSRSDRIRIGFHEGNIVSAESRRKLYDNRLGRILVREGVVSIDNLKRVIEEQKKSGHKLGHILVARKLVSADKIRKHLTGQITEMVVHIFAWKEGRYVFNPQAVPIDKELNLSVDTNHILMDGMRMHDEWSVMEGKITLDTVFEHTGQAGVGLSPEELEVLSFVDDESDVETIAEVSGRDEFEISKLLLTLLEKGVVDVKKEKAEEDAGKAAVKKKLAEFKYLSETFFVAAALISLVLVSMFGTSSFELTSAEEDVDFLKFKIEHYRIESGIYPPTLDEVAAGNDLWGNPYSYELSEGEYFLRSSGPDGIFGNGDDIF